ncbi:MAG: hypothetical protein QOG83_2670 [Alphaproteobacteria bacterium]|nr:hypothetical protein [Alphaproteobacteria bacterium]
MNQRPSDARCTTLALLSGAGVIALGLMAPPSAAQMQKVGVPPEASNMRLVGFNDLNARSAYQPTIQKQGNRYIAYIGHHGHTADLPKPINPVTGQVEYNGTSIIDVTDPANPKYLKHIPGSEGGTEAGGAQMTRVCPGTNLPRADRNKFYLLRSFGVTAHETWDVTDPANPALLATIGGNYRDTHKSFWECGTGIAYVVSGVPGWRVKRMTEIYDLGDPAKPVKIRDFGLPGQEPGSTGAVPTDLHGPISMPELNRVYFGYGSSAGGMLQIVDREKLLKGPKEPTPANLLYPQISRMDMYPLVGAHTVFPMIQMQIEEFANDGVSKRDMVMFVNEATRNECKPQAREMVFFADITVETHPMVVSNYNVRESSGNFCSRGGRFGAHSSNESMAPVFYKKLAMIAFFNAGLRVIDVRDPYSPKEIAHFIPSITESTDKRCVQVEGTQRCKVAIQTNNVETDERGYIYIVDRANTGLHILELTGTARAIAGLPPL